MVGTVPSVSTTSGNTQRAMLTPAMVKAAAARYLDPKNVARFMLVPEGGTTP